MFLEPKKFIVCVEFLVLAYLKGDHPFEKNEFIASGRQELKQKLLKILSGQQIIYKRWLAQHFR